MTAVISPLRKNTFTELCDIVYASSGIVLGPRKEALVSSRVGKRMHTLGLRDYDDYLRLISRDEREIVGLVDAVSTNVTSFFREPHHFEYLAEQAIQWYERGQRRFRIWSAACSTGEEPYSLAIALREVLPLDADVRILATDISTRALAHSKEGVYSMERVAPVCPERLQRWFVRVKQGDDIAWQVKPIINKMVVFRRMNLAAPPFPMRGPLDAVFCRNVMIYFDETVRQGILAESHRLLAPNGLLLVGHAESLAGTVSDFKYLRPSVYRKA